MHQRSAPSYLGFSEGGLYQPGMVPRVPSGRDFNLPPWDPEALPSDVILPPEFTQDELDMLLETLSPPASSSGPSASRGN